MISFKPLLCATLVLLGCYSLTVSAAPGPNIPVAQNPCGDKDDDLKRMGTADTSIYNESDFEWIVTFNTRSNGGIPSINAGVVKYLKDGFWIDLGTGNSTRNSYKITVPSHASVQIAYCSAGAHEKTEIKGNVSFKANVENYRNGTPGGVEFSSTYREAPHFENSGDTRFVDYNRTNTTAYADGNITICPNDKQCTR